MWIPRSCRLDLVDWLIIVSLSSHKVVRRERAPRSNLVTVEVEQERDWHQNGCDAAQEGSGPIDA